VAMTGERDVAGFTRQRGGGEVSDRLVEDVGLGAFHDHRRDLQPRDVDPADHAAVGDRVALPGGLLRRRRGARLRGRALRTLEAGERLAPLFERLHGAVLEGTALVPAVKPPAEK